MRIPLLLCCLVVLLPLAGCHDVDNTPPAAAMRPRTDPPPKIPVTMEEKIAAINKAALPPDAKKKAIEQVRGGKL